MCNIVTVWGRLGAQPELRDAGSSKVANFSVAINDGYKDKKTGDWVDKTIWARVTAWGYSAEKVAALEKGELVLVEGQLDSKDWTDKHEQKRTDVFIKANRIKPTTIRKRNLDDGGSSEHSETTETASAGNEKKIPF